MADKIIHLPKRKLTVELNIQVPDSSTFPTAKDREDFDKRADRWFRKRMREGGQR